MTLSRFDLPCPTAPVTRMLCFCDRSSPMVISALAMPSRPSTKVMPFAVDMPQSCRGCTSLKSTIGSLRLCAFSAISATAFKASAADIFSSSMGNVSLTFHVGVCLVRSKLVPIDLISSKEHHSGRFLGSSTRIIKLMPYRGASDTSVMIRR